MKKNYLLFASAALFFNLHAQQVTTFAGKQYVGSGKYNGTTNTNLLDDEYSVPHGLGLDTNNRIYLTDQHNIILLDGSLSRQRGGYTGDPNEPGAIGEYRGSGTVSRFNTPRGVYVNPKTNEVFICDADNGKIRKGSAYVNSSNPNIWDGVNTLDPNDDNTYAGIYNFLGGYKDGAKNQAEFSTPEDLVITSTGVMYIADYGNDCIRKISGSTVSTFAGKGQTTGDQDGTGANARFSAPSGLFLENDNSLLVADRNNGKIRRVNLSTGAVTTVVSGLKYPADVVSVDGILYIADDYCIKSWDGSKLRLFAGKAGVYGYTNGNDSTARFGDLGLMIYRKSDRSIYICDRENNVVRRVTVTQPPVADFYANKVNISVNEITVLHSTSSYANTFSWSISPGTYSLQNGSKLTDSVVYVSFSATGSYTIALTASNLTGNNTKTKNNYINVSLIGTAKPTANFYANKTSVKVGDTVDLIDQSTDNPQSWTWTITPNTFSFVSGSTANSRFPRVVFNASGSYSVSLKAGNTNGDHTATKNSYIVVAVNGLTTPYAESLNLYPNPASSVVYVGGNIEKISLFTATGKQVSVNLDNGKIDVSALSQGVYCLKGVKNDGTPVQGKFVKANP